LYVEAGLTTSSLSFLVQYHLTTSCPFFNEIAFDVVAAAPLTVLTVIFTVVDVKSAAAAIYQSISSPVPSSNDLMNTVSHTANPDVSSNVKAAVLKEVKAVVLAAQRFVVKSNVL
jgi:hypothetical protein